MMARLAASALAVALLLIVVGSAAADGDQIALKDVAISLLEASGTPAFEKELTGPSEAQLGTLDHTRTLKVVLTTAPLASAPSDEFRPQQVFLRLTSLVSGAAAYFAAVKAKDGTLYTTAKSGDIQKQVGVQGGAYDVALLVGDTRVPQPLLWVLGEVKVLHPPLDDGSQPEGTAYRAMDRLFQPLPEILHMHRQPERRAPAIVSLVFTLLSAVPVVLYVLVALQLGGNLEGFPSGAGFLAAAGFHLGLLAILALYLLFWIKLNLMQTLPALVVLAAVTTVLGSATLGQLDPQRPKQA